jgi:3-oxoadipate enol-lactonase
MELNLTDRLPELDIPTLIMVGRQDPTTTVAGSEVIHRAIAGSRLAIIEDAAHISNVEQPEAFTAILRGFLDEQAARARARPAGAQRR